MDRLSASFLAKYFEKDFDDGVVKRLGHLFILWYVPFELVVTFAADKKDMIVVFPSPESQGHNMMPGSWFSLIATRAMDNRSHCYLQQSSQSHHKG